MFRRMRCRSLFLLVGLFLVSSCDREPPTTLPDEHPSFLIEDAVHGGGNEHFYWLPPMITPMPEVSRVFDGAADPTVRVCEGAVSGCANPIITFTATSGLAVNSLDEWYGVDWYVFDHDPAEGDVFRVSVSASGQELGFADIQIVDKVTGRLKNEIDGDYILLSENKAGSSSRSGSGSKRAHSVSRSMRHRSASASS